MEIAAVQLGSKRMPGARPKKDFLTDASPQQKMCSGMRESYANLTLARESDAGEG
jgi:hypothetical protein